MSCQPHFMSFVNLTGSVYRTAAGTVEDRFGATGHRADTAGQVQDAVTASLAAFRPFSLAFSDAKKAGIDPGQQGGFHEFLCQNWMPAPQAIESTAW